MSQRKRCPALAFLVLFILCTFGLSAKTALAQASTPTAPPIKSFGPVTDYNAALPNSSNVLRFTRGERYDVPDPALPALGEQSDAVGVVEDMSSFYHDPMPFNQSDAVVFGSIASGQAFLTNDKRAIYSEFKLNVQEALKVPTSRYISRQATALTLNVKAERSDCPPAKFSFEARRIILCPRSANVICCS
jgi:hypothetical protein